MLFERGNNVAASGKRGKRVFLKITTKELSSASGLSERTVWRDIQNKKLNPVSLEDIISWVNEPRIRSNKGKPLP